MQLKTVFNTLKKQKKNYIIYQINIGNTVYIGSTNNYSRRMNEHLDQLKLNQHHNRKLQDSYLTHKQFDSKILLELESYSRYRVLKWEQRLIALLSNSNEAKASNSVMFDFNEFVITLIDRIL